MLNRLLTIRSDLLGFIHILSRISILLFLAYVVYITSRHSIYLALIAFYFYCVIYNFSSWVGIGHELSHGTIFKSKSLNGFFLSLFSCLTFSNEVLFMVTHSEHHKCPHGLTDFETPYKCMPRPKPPWNQRFYAVFDIPKFISTMHYLWLNSQGIIPHERLKAMLEHRMKSQMVAQAAQGKILYFFALIAASLMLKSTLPIVFLVLPSFIATCLTKNLALLQHPTIPLLKSLNLNHVTVEGKQIFIENLTDEQVRDGLDLGLPIIFQFLYANMNYHATHHKNPSIPFYNLPDASTSLLISHEVMRIEISTGTLLRLMVKSL